MEAIASLLRDAPPPSPPPSPPLYVLEDNVPDILTFMGFIVYGISLVFSGTECAERAAAAGGGFHDYSDAPVYLLLGLLVGVVAFALALFDGAALGGPVHSALTTGAFVLFAKHLARHAEFGARRASTIIMTGALPLLSLAVLEAGRVRVRNARFFYALMLTFSAMPLPHLFRSWMPGGASSFSDAKVRSFFARSPRSLCKKLDQKTTGTIQRAPHWPKLKVFLGHEAVFYALLCCVCLCGCEYANAQQADQASGRRAAVCRGLFRPQHGVLCARRFVGAL